MANTVSATNINKMRRETEVWLRKFKNITPSSIVQEKQNLLVIYKLAHKMLLTTTPHEAERVTTEMQEIGGKIFEALSDNKNFDNKKTILDICKPLGADVDALNYHYVNSTKKPDSVEAALIVYRQMRAQLSKS